MAKKTFRIKDKQGNDVDYVIPASRVALDSNTDLDKKIGDIEDEIDEVDGSAVKKITFNGGTPETPDEHGNVSLNQAKADWSERNSNSPKFIEHKPDIVEDVFYEEQTRTFKKNKNGTVSEIMTLPEQESSGYEPPQGGIPKTDLATAVQESLNLADSSLQPSDKTQLQGAITQLQNALNTLIGSGNVQGAIDTFNEVVAFLEGIDTDDPTLFNQLKSLSDAITALQNTLSQKANDNAVVKSISVNGGSAQTPTQGNVNIQVQGTEGKSAYQSYYDTTSDNPKMTEAQWVAAVLRSAYRSYLATTSDNPVMTETQWVASLKGPKGDTGNVVFEDLEDLVALLVNDLTTGGPGNFLSAEMGKRLAAMIGALEDTVEELDEGAGYDINVTETAIVFTSRSMPHVNVGDVGNHNVSCKAGNTATTSFYVSGRNLENNIQIAVSDATNWSVSQPTISPTNGKVALTLVTITYQPASGTTAGTTHNCNVVVSCGGTTYDTIAMRGTVAAAPSITLTLSSATITTTSGTAATATLNVKGAALEGDIALAISGTGSSYFSLSDNSVSKADAESAAGADIIVTFDGSASGDIIITASSTNATDATASVSGVIPTALSEGSYFFVPANTGTGYVRYNVLSNGNVSVGKPRVYNYPAPPPSLEVNPTSTVENPLVIPSVVSDSDAVAVYDSSGTPIDASGFTYNVTTVAFQGFKQLGNLKAITLPEGLTTILGNDSFQQSGLKEITFPSTFTTFANTDNFANCSSLEKVEFLSSAHILGNTFRNCTNLTKVILNGNTMANGAFSGCTKFIATSGDKPIVVNRATTYYNYRANSGVTPFPQNENNKVWATLYCKTSAGFPGTGDPSWACFADVQDISNYQE